MSIGNSQSSTCIVCRSTFVRRATINCCVVYRPHSTTPLSTPTPTSSWGFFRGNRVGRVGEDPREDVVVDIVECGLMPAVLAVDCYSTFRYLFSPGLITVTDKLCILLLAASPAIQAVLDAVCCHRCCTSVCLSVCLLVTTVSSAKTAEPLEMPFGTDSHQGTLANTAGWCGGAACRYHYSNNLLLLCACKRCSVIIRYRCLAYFLRELHADNFCCVTALRNVGHQYTYNVLFISMLRWREKIKRCYFLYVLSANVSPRPEIMKSN